MPKERARTKSKDKEAHKAKPSIYSAFSGMGGGNPASSGGNTMSSGRNSMIVDYQINRGGGDK